MDHMKSWHRTKLLGIYLPKKTVYFTATSNSENYSVDTNDDKDKNYQFSITDDGENDETEDPIETAKKLPTSAAQIETDLF